jgi:nucleotide-binding universal stress UspA family protein
MLLPLLSLVGFERMVLVRAFDDPPRGATVEGEAEVVDYLDSCARRIEGFGFETQVHAGLGQPADQILETARQQAAALILIATHGRDGLERWRLGSVADEVVRQSDCPALVIGPNVKVSLSPYVLRRILVPLDGSPLAEAALPVAATSR